MAGRFSVETVFKAVDKITAPVRRIQNRVGKMARSMSRSMRRFDRVVNSVLRSLKSVTTTAIKFGAIGLGAVTAAIGFMVREFSKIENAEAAFTPLLGGVKKAKELVAALNKTAASTPFQFNNLSDAAKQLLPVMNGDISGVIKTLRMLGDTAGGNAQKLDSITRGFTKAMLKGKVDMESLNMIAEAGVPIFGELAAVMGTKVNAAFFKMISAGKVGTVQLTKAFERMTSEGGIFFKGMEIASKTLSGMWSTLKDDVKLTAATIGSAFESVIKRLIARAIEIAGKIRTWAENNRELIKQHVEKHVEKIKIKIFELIASFKKLNQEQSVFDRLKKVLTVVLKVIGFLVNHRRGVLILVAAIVILSTVLKVLAAVLTAVNLVMMVNPAVLITLAVIALIAAVVAAIKWFEKMHWSLKLIFAGFMLLLGPIGWFILAATLIVKYWEPIGKFFADLWDGIVGGFMAMVNLIKDNMDKIKGAFKFVANPLGTVIKFFQRDGDEAGVGSDDFSPQTAGPQERAINSFEEKRTVSSTEVTIKDDTGRAEVTGGKLGPGLSVKPSGVF